MPLIVVERDYDPPLTPADFATLISRPDPCLSVRGVSLVQSFLSTDGRRGVCVFEAPDAEAVREGNREAGLPFRRVWAAALHEPAA